MYKKMLAAHPSPHANLPGLAVMVEECFSCAAACESCADACLAESKPDMLRRCIQLNQVCSDVCLATGRAAVKMNLDQPGLTQALYIACVEACKACGDECQRHAKMHEHCRLCAEACYACAEACHEQASGSGGTRLAAGW